MFQKDKIYTFIDFNHDKNELKICSSCLFYQLCNYHMYGSDLVA